MNNFFYGQAWFTQFYFTIEALVVALFCWKGKDKHWVIMVALFVAIGVLIRRFQIFTSIDPYNYGERRLLAYWMIGFGIVYYFKKVIWREILGLYYLLEYLVGELWVWIKKTIKWLN